MPGRTDDAARKNLADGAPLADILFGDTNPSGRLPITFPKSYAQLPDFANYSMRGRTYRFMAREPLYRFGYGLSYTTFRYAKLRLNPRVVHVGEGVTVNVDVRNTGAIAGEEVVQLYVSDVKASVPVPRLHLEGIKRVRLAPGKRRTVRFRLSASQLAATDRNGEPFGEPGAFRISVGGGQPDDPHANAVTATLRVK